jgi:AraC-like DNA-binding protein
MIPVHILPQEEINEIKVVELPILSKIPISEAHRHQFYECFVFLKGGGSHIIDFIEFPILDNSIHIITPGQVHQVNRASSSYGFVYMFDLLHFGNQKNIEDFLFDHACFDVNEFSPLYHFETHFNDTLTNVTKQSCLDSHQNSPFKSQMMISQLSLLILYCMQYAFSKNGQNESKHKDVYTNFRRLLNTNFKTMKKVKEYAHELNITEKLLNDIVLLRTGEPVSSLIFKQIVLEAKRLLKSGVSTKHVAYDLNFTDPAHFSKFFKSQTGFSPSSFK